MVNIEAVKNKKKNGAPIWTILTLLNLWWTLLLIWVLYEELTVENEIENMDKPVFESDLESSDESEWV